MLLAIVKDIWDILRGTAAKWLSDQASSISAALAFYCAFSLAPLLVIIVTVAGAIVGTETASGYIGEQLTALFGKTSAEVLIEAMRNSQTARGTFAAVVSAVTLVFAATTVFVALESALEQVWGARGAAPAGWRGFVRSRIVSFGFVLAIGFLLLVSLSVTTALASLRGYFAARFPAFVALMAGVDLVLSLSMSTGLIALIYRYIPATRLAWKPVLQGALITALLLHLGKWVIGLYLGRSTQPSAFGAASSFVALLLWLYYSAQVFLYGAEVTAYLGRLREARARNPNAVPEIEPARRS